MLGEWTRTAMKMHEDGWPRPENTDADADGETTPGPHMPMQRM